MPFLSKSQERKCFSLKSKGKAGSWDCKKWAKMTNQKSLPTYAPKKIKRK
jgi:hypothetical protein